MKELISIKDVKKLAFWVTNYNDVLLMTHGGKIYIDGLVFDLNDHPQLLKKLIVHCEKMVIKQVSQPLILRAYSMLGYDVSIADIGRHWYGWDYALPPITNALSDCRIPFKMIGGYAIIEHERDAIQMTLAHDVAYEVASQTIPKIKSSR